MSYVNHKTTTPGGSDLYGYAFLSLPNPKSPTNPKGVTIDEKIMPARDIYDNTHGTNTWKEMHGVDLYFLQEGAAERQYAPRQFNDGRASETAQYPKSGWQSWASWSAGNIYSSSWRTLVGRWSELQEPNHYSGIGWGYRDYFLNITDEYDLPDEVYTWQDGTPLEGTPIPAGHEHAGKYLRDWPQDALIQTPFNQSMMRSHMSDFTSGHPLVAQDIRKLYRDMEPLKYYMLQFGLGSGSTLNDGYHTSITATDWYLSFSDYLNWNVYPQTPSPNIIVDEITQCFGNPVYQGRIEIFEVTDGYWRVPYCGKYGYNPGQYEPIWGSEVAMYALLELDWSNSNSSWNTRKYGLFKMANYSINRSGGWAEIYPRDLVPAAYKLINHYNAEIPHTMPTNWRDERNTRVTIQQIYSVCKLTDRTDTTQLNWNLRPQ